MTDSQYETSRRDWVSTCAYRYWGDQAHAVSALSFSRHACEDLPSGRWVFVLLPDWAKDCGVNGCILVDEASVDSDQEGPPWESCDWIYAAWLFLTGAYERAHEKSNGPTHSYSSRLEQRHEALFDHAWVNRIFLFLRRWAARDSNHTEQDLFGDLPDTEIILTHDVDAIRLTPEIRLKQAAFQVAKLGSSFVEGKFERSIESARNGVRFLTHSGDLRTLSLVRSMEEGAGIRSRIYFYAGDAGLKRKIPRAFLIDPAYDIQSPYLRKELTAFVDGGWEIGLHPSSGAWADPSQMHEQKIRLESAAGIEAKFCRQHWLRFSFLETWKAQEKAGFANDATLGFNDRPGFRCSHALRLNPWNTAENAALKISATPILFMDSHFYDYHPMPHSERLSAITKWLDEVRAVKGQITVNWHTHTITPAYGWRDGYEALLSYLK